MGFVSSFFGGPAVSLALKFFTGPALSFASGIVKSMNDTHAAVVASQTGLATAQSQAVLATETSRYHDLANVTAAMLSHPIWWVGWALFVLPVGFYDALIHMKSVLCPFIDSACTWDIKRVPATQEAWDQMVVLSFFGLAAASSLAGTIANKIGSPR